MEDSPSALFQFADTPAQKEPQANAEFADPPIAAIQLETSVPHLDRPFDYLVPQDLQERALPGVRVKTKFGNQVLGGYILERKTSTQTQAQLQVLDRVVSDQPVLPQSTYLLCKLVAQRFAGTTADVIRAAVPPRVASVDKNFSPSVGNDPQDFTCLFNISHYGTEVANLPQRLAHQELVRARMLVPTRYGQNSWMQATVHLLQEIIRTGTSAIVVVPNQQLLNQLSRTFDDLGISTIVNRLTADDGPSPRYRSYLQVLHGQNRIVIGTRSAIFAPMQKGAALIIIDDADTNHYEPRAPYWNTRDVALLRAEREDLSLIFLSWRHSIHTQRLVALGYLEDYEPHRQHRQELYPRVVVAADEYYQQRDYGPGSQRIPTVAWQAITAGLRKGPVLIQVARTGFIPAVRCTRCGTQAQCHKCSGPLGYQDQHSMTQQTLVCRWCGELEHAPQCKQCSSTIFKAAHRGAERTAEELGRAFTNVPVVSSAGEHIKDYIPDQPALIVATPGAEPIAPQGYAATILLDGNTMLAREGLETPESVFGRWISAVALTQSHQDEGLVVVTADAGMETNTLARLDVPGYYQQVLSQRSQTNLPPVRRLATIECGTGTLQEFLDHVQRKLEEPLEIIGPAPLGEEGSRMRALLFFSYKSGATITAALKGSKATLSAQKKLSSEPLRIRIDPEDVL